MNIKVIKEIGRNPNVDWIIILILTVGGIVALGFTGYTLYNAVTHGSIQAKVVAKKASFEKLDEKAISSVIDRFAHKKEVSAQTRKAYTGATDPSI